jgi:aspartate-semialdehyde dehydrogenase
MPSSGYPRDESSTDDTQNTDNLREYTSTLKLIKKILYAGQWMLVLDGNCVQIPIIDAHSLRAILLLYKQYRKSPRREAAMDIALG